VSELIVSTDTGAGGDPPFRHTVTTIIYAIFVDAYQCNVASVQKNCDRIVTVGHL
jgi:hypothetical protein